MKENYDYNYESIFKNEEPEKDTFIFLNDKYYKYCKESENIINNNIQIIDKNASIVDTYEEIYNHYIYNTIENNCDKFKEGKWTCKLFVNELYDNVFQIQKENLFNTYLYIDINEYKNNTKNVITINNEYNCYIAKIVKE